MRSNSEIGRREKAHMNEVTLPITKTGRKYGYITWRKKDDKIIRALLGEREHLELRVDNNEPAQKRIDWKQRRIGITYTLTRNLPPATTQYVLTKSKNGGFRLSVS